MLMLSLHKRYIHVVVEVACCGRVELEDYINFVQNDPTFIPLLNSRTPFLTLNSPSSTSRIHLEDTIIFISMVYADVAQQTWFSTDSKLNPKCLDTLPKT